MAPVGAFGALKQWALLYVKHRDITVKKIAGIKDTGVLIFTTGCATVLRSFRG